MILIFKLIMLFLKFVGNKTKRWEKTRQIFRKNEHFLPPDTHKYMFMYVLPNQIFQILY